MQKPPNILWPGVIIAFLLFGAVTTFGVLFASKSDGGAQVVDDYYRKSVAWDSLAADKQASSALGWVVRVEVRSSEDPSAQATLGVVTFLDATGSPILGLEGSVVVSRPQSAVTYGTHRVVTDGTADGRYTFSFPYRAPGLWDLDIVASRDGERFTKKIRIEI